MGLLSKADNTYLGIDIGDSSLKMVELKKKGKNIFLSNYGFSEDLGKKKFISEEDIDYLADTINRIKNEVGINSKRAVASLPTFAVFSSIINIHNADKKNLQSQIEEEAKKVIPLPLEEMVLDWKLINPAEGDNSKNTKIFLTGSPKKLVRKYINIFNKAKITLVSLETETFSLVRSLLGNDKSTIMVVEIGANSTDLFVSKESIPVLNRSIDVCGTTITQAISKRLNIDIKKAEQMKIDLVVSKTTEDEEMPDFLIEAIKPIINEIKYMFESFENNYKEKIEKIVLSGGSALLFNLDKYLSNLMNVNVIIGDPWARISYPRDLQPIIKELGPKLAVAIGLALREIE